MNPITVAITMKALDCLSVREEVAAENIANAGTIGYRPLHVSFETALSAAANEGRQAVASVEPKIERQNGLSAQGLRLDLELATAAGTAGRYTALIDILGRQMSLDQLAISGSV